MFLDRDDILSLFVVTHLADTRGRQAGTSHRSRACGQERAAVLGCVRIFDQRRGWVLDVVFLEEIQASETFSVGKQTLDFSTHGFDIGIVKTEQLPGEDLAVPDVESDRGVIPHGVTRDDCGGVWADTLDGLEPLHQRLLVGGVEGVGIMLDEGFGEAADVLGSVAYG